MVINSHANGFPVSLFTRILRYTHKRMQKVKLEVGIKFIAPFMAKD